MSYLRAKAHATRKQRDDQKPPRKKKLSIFAPKFPALHQYDNYNNETSAHERNLIALQEEEEKLHPNEDIVTDLMKNTFFIRRQNILKASTSVTNLLRIYPSLRNYNQVSITHTYVTNYLVRIQNLKVLTIALVYVVVFHKISSYIYSSA